MRRPVGAPMFKLYCVCKTFSLKKFNKARSCHITTKLYCELCVQKSNFCHEQRRRQLLNNITFNSILNLLVAPITRTAVSGISTAVMRALNVLKHWVSKYQQVAALGMCG